MSSNEISERKPSKLSMGPNLFKWQPEIWRDFYFRLADEAPLDTVYLGEVVCAKRSSFVMPYWDEVVERLETGGKEVVLSTLALVMNKNERQAVGDIVTGSGHRVEINDISAYAHFSTDAPGRPHIIGPMINCYNEEAIAYFVRHGATRICLPVELPVSTLKILGEQVMRNEQARIELEVMAFGRMPLAVSARCYHARLHKLSKDSCQFVCGEDQDGLSLQTLDDEEFLTINGIQTMSHSYLNLLNELSMLVELGINSFRLSPHSCDMVEVSHLYRSVLDQQISAQEATHRLADMGLDAPFSNGYLHDQPGVTWASVTTTGS